MEPDLTAALRSEGFAFVEGGVMRDRLARSGPLTDEDAFAASWNDLALDPFMADQGKYRRRRHATFAFDSSGQLTRQPHQPHFQAREYNALNGGIERWFEPILPAIAGGDSLRTILHDSHRLFERVAGTPRAWHVEVHQFRIEARAGAPGQPTPEGLHRDGVDYVLVLLVRRQNIASGTTTIHRPGGQLLGSFTLTRPFDAALLDDARVFHGVTSVEPLDPSLPGHRDVLVATFRAAPTVEVGTER